MTNSVSLGSNHNTFERLIHMFSGHLHECNTAISSYRYALSLLPRSAPTHASYVHSLATARLKRYLLSKQLEDLEQSILGFTEAILSPPCLQGRLGPDPFPNINQAFHSLTLAISLRIDKSRHSEDVKYHIIYLRYLRGLPYDVRNDFSFDVTGFLVSALGDQVEVGLGDVDQGIEEMAD